MKLFLFVITLLLAIPQVLANPAFSNPSPSTGSYVFGRDTDLFSINISDSLLNTRTAKFHIRVNDPTSIWSNISLSCSNSSLSNWNCNTTVTGLSALLKDGDTLLYYFDAYNTNNEYGNYSSSTDPMKAKVDRSFPQIFFNLPLNNSYVSGYHAIAMRASDAYSGVNSSTVKYSFDNSTFKDMTNTSGVFTNNDPWTTGTYSDNQSVNIYAKATDNVNNQNYTFITVSIDNQPPTIGSASPSSNQILTDTSTLSFNAQDSHSGIKDSSGAYEIVNSNYSMGCTNGLCSKSFDSTGIPDGQYTMEFFISDNAGNSVNYSVNNLVIDNLPPHISITSISNGQVLLQGVFLLAATVIDAGSGVKNVQYQWKKGSTTVTWTSMDCYSSTCNTTFDTSTVQAGEYTISVKAIDNVNHESISYVTVQFSAGGGTSGSSSSSSSAPSSSGSNTSVGSGGSGGSLGSGSAQGSGNNVCGNNICETGETCSSCEADCGKCGSVLIPALNIRIDQTILFIAIGIIIVIILVYLFVPSAKSTVVTPQQR